MAILIDAFYLLLIASFGYSDFVLVSDMDAGVIYRIDTVTGVSTVAISGQVRPTAVGYDSNLRMIFWSDITLDCMKSASIDGTGESVIYQFGDSSIHSIALSPNERRIYYVDNPNAIVGVMDYDGSNQQNLITGSGLCCPRGIAVDPLTRLMFIADPAAAPGKFWSANMDDGSDLKVIYALSGDTYWNNGIAVDTTTQELFWADSYYSEIQRMDYNGANHAYIGAFEGMRWFAVAVDDNNVYATFTASELITTINTLSVFPRTGGSRSALGTQTFGQQGGICFVKEDV